MPSLLFFGLGYTASRIAREVAAKGWEVMSTGSTGSMAFDDESSVRLAIDRATHIVSSVPPMVDGDPVLGAYGRAIEGSEAWIGYLSSTGVYGDTKGAWVDETASVIGRRINRNEADQEWQERGAHVFRLPGIYGPGRSALDRMRQGKAHRVDLSDQVFSRIHVDDIVSGVIAGFDAAAGVFNLADDHPCSQNEVIEFACQLLGVEPPKLLALDDANLSAEARAFYAENRRVANGKAKRLLGWQPKYSDFRAGLAEIAQGQPVD